MLQECFEDIIDQDGDALGVSFEAALELMTKKCKQGSASICRSMGASVVDGLDGKGDPDSFFFEIDNYSLTPGIDGSLSFTGHLTGEGWRDGSCNFSLRPADWDFPVSAEEVQSAK
ncbi:guanine nucleotide-binding protein subunit gamma [Cryptococcus deuterogattii R265]|nr:guanine nucleotide-binding protein subunit gamma [Cryptococcus deuterogattii R265]